MWRVKTKVIVAMIAIIVCTVTILGYWNYSDSEDLAIKILKSNNYTELKNISDYYFDKLVHDMEYIVNYWSEAPEIRAYEKAPSQERIIDSIPDNFIGIHEKWMGLVVSSDDIAWIYYALETDGSIFIAPVDPTMPSDYVATQRGWYQTAVAANGEIVWSEPYLDAGDSGKIIQTISRAVYDDNRRLKGVIGVDIELDKFTQIIHELSFSQQSKIFLINNQNTILAHNMDLLKPEKEKIIFDLSEYDTSETVRINGETFVLSVVPLRVNGWRLAAISNTNIEGELAQIKTKIILTMILMLVIAIVAALLLSHNILNPLYQLIDRISHIMKGNFNEQTGIVRKDEFGMLSKSFDDLLGELNENYIDTVKVLANAIEASDEYTRGHCDRVGGWSMAIGQRMNLSKHELEQLKIACILHDVGKIGIPNEILNKPGPLTEEEFEEIQAHPLIGYNMIKEVRFLGEASEIMRQHHERIDGKGYPHKLKGSEIRIEAKILCVADAMDAMMSKRSYRANPLTIAEVKEQLIKNKDTQFDGEIVEYALKLL